MKKILLITLSALFAISYSVKAQTDIDGNYNGDLIVSVVWPTSVIETLPSTNILINKEDGAETYSLSIKDFSFGENLPLGDLNVTNITRTDDAGITTLSKDEPSLMHLVLLQMDVEIFLGDVTIDDQETLNLNLTVKFTEEADGNEIANVSFVGPKQPDTSLSETKNDPINIHIDEYSIKVGEEAENYTIYNTAGVTVQSGKITDRSIGIADLNKGIYLIKIDGSIVKFFKK